MKIALSLICLITGFSLSVNAQDRAFTSVEVELQRLIQDAGLKHGQVGFVAVNLDNGKVIAEHHPYRSMVPASILKLVTTASALDQLGPGFRFQTRVTYTGEIVEGVLHGNLIIHGAGDPTLQSRYFTSQDHASKLIDAIQKAGIKTVEGKVIIDMSAFAKHTTPDEWAWEDLGNYFGATPTAWMWEDNMMKVHLRSGQPGSDVMLAKPWPEDSPARLELQIKAAESGGDNAWFFSAPGSDIIYGKGTIPAHQSDFVVKLSHPDVAHAFGKHLIEQAGLGAAELEVQYLHIPYSDEREVITLTSVALSELVTVTNHESVNLFAEALNIALDTNQRYKTVEGGLAATHRFLKQQAIPTSGVRLEDGSGMSPTNRVTPQFMVDLLSAMYRDEQFEVFHSTLPTGGESGTLKWYFKSGNAHGTLRAKSGTMNGVRNYAGYVPNKYDETIAFCLMLNDYDEDRKAAIMKKVENLIEAVIQD